MCRSLQPVTRSPNSPHRTGPYTRLLTNTLNALACALGFTATAHGQHLNQAQTTATAMVAAQRIARSADPLPKTHCFDRPYAPEKKLASDSSPTERNSEAQEPVGDDIPENDGRILMRDKPLPVPPEIQRIRRGYVKRFTGAFINDGLEHWDGVDLDRSLVIVVQRRIHDQRAAMSPPPFDDPNFPPKNNSGVIFGRKFTNELRTELEVISILSTDRGELEAFVCIANAAWAAPPQGPVMISDGFMSSELLDEESKGERRLIYRKSMHALALDAVLEHDLERYMRQPTWR